MHKARSCGGGFFRNTYLRTAHFGRQIDNFFRANGNKIRDVAMMVAPLLAPEKPALASAVGVVGQVPLRTASSAIVSSRPANLV